MKPKTTEGKGIKENKINKLKKDWERINTIKTMCYGCGIVSREEALDYWRDRDKIQKKYNRLNNL